MEKPIIAENGSYIILSMLLLQLLWTSNKKKTD